MPQGLGNRTWRTGRSSLLGPAEAEAEITNPNRGPYSGYFQGSDGRRIPVYSNRTSGGGTNRTSGGGTGWQDGPSYPTTPAQQQPGSAPVVTDRAGTGTYTGPDGSGMQGRARNALNRMQGYGNQMAGLAGQAANMYGSVYAPGVRQAYQTANMPVQDVVDRASIDTGLAFNKSQGILNRNMSRMGINPNSGRFQGLQQQWGLARAAAEAGAMTRARRQGQEDNFRRLLSAVGLAGNSFGQATNALSGAAGISGDAAGQYDRWATEEGARKSFAESGGQYGSQGGGQAGSASPLQQEIDQDLGSSPARQTYSERQASNKQRYADRQQRNRDVYANRQNALR